MKRLETTALAVMMILSGAVMIMDFSNEADADLYDGSILKDRSPIKIDGNSDFTSANGVSSGSGTESDPFIIENFRIDASEETGIFINNTDKYFIIRNCRIFDGSIHEPIINDGILLRYVSNGSVQNCLLENNNGGVAGNSCSNMVVHNNTATSNFDGIRFYGPGSNLIITNNSCFDDGMAIQLRNDVDNSFVANNTCMRSRHVGIDIRSDCDNNIIEYNHCLEAYDTYYAEDSNAVGISVDYSSNNVIRYNNCSGNSARGILIEFSDNNLIEGNTLMNNKVRASGLSGSGLLISGSKYNIFRNNRMENCGIRFYSYKDNDTISNSIDRSNKVNGKDIVFLKGSTIPETISGDVGLVIISNCENKIVKDLVFDGISPGISVFHSSGIKINGIRLKNVLEGIIADYSEDVIIDNIEIDDFRHGISTYICRDLVLSNITLKNGVFGFYCLGLQFSVLENNEIFNVDEGIRIGGLPTSGSDIVKGNVVSGGRKGIFAGGSRHQIIENIIDSQEVFGIEITGTDIQISDNHLLANSVGIYILLKTEALIEKNNIFGNDVGIYSENDMIANVIRWNNISHSEGFGIDFFYDQIKDNSIYENVFYNNNKGGVQARDKGDASLWDDNSSSGNYWSDYGKRYGSSASNNGTVWNIPYVLADGISRDNYPLVNPPISLSGILRISRDHQREAPVDKDYSHTYRVPYSGDRPENITWSFSTNADWLTFDENHTLKGKPTSSDIGSYWVNISVTDGVLSDFTNFTITVLVKNFAPVITTNDTTSVNQWEKYSVDYDASDDSPILEWRLVTEAAFLSIDSRTGLLFGTPGLHDVGVFQVNVSVNDGELWDVNEFDLTVIDVNDPPMMNRSFTNILMAEDESSTYILSDIFFNYDNDPLDISVGAPENISASINNGMLTIVPGENWYGIGVLNFSVSDGHYDLTFLIDIRIVEINDPPSDLKIIFKNITLKEGGDQIVSASFFDPDIGDDANITWFVNGSVVSYNVTFNLSLPAGIYNLTLRVTDSSGNYTEISVPITVQSSFTPPDPDPDTDFPWIIVIAASMILLILAGTAAFFLRRRSKGEEETTQPIPSAPTTRRKPGDPLPDLEPIREIDPSEIRGGNLAGDPA
ncbi:MAG: right-handed parallel beta-helix repeat-containing protein [Thermoplasmatota archaeon]